MKLVCSILIGAAFVFSGPAFSSPRIGDSATYTGWMLLLGEAVEFTKEVTLTDFDRDSNNFTQVDITYVEGQEPAIEESTVSLDDLMSDEAADQLLATCSEEGGVRETMQVAAGEFDTCRSTDESNGGTVNLGKVPFGTVKIDVPGQFEIELSAFSRGE